MIRYGMLCSSCRGSCKNEGIDSQPIEIECPECDGHADGCDHCREGFVQIQGCPQKFCSDVVEAVQLFDLYEKGLPPIAGGALDQSAWFIDAFSRFRYEEAAIKVERIHGD